MAPGALKAVNHNYTGLSSTNNQEFNAQKNVWLLSLIKEPQEVHFLI